MPLELHYDNTPEGRAWAEDQERKWHRDCEWREEKRQVVAELEKINSDNPEYDTIQKALRFLK